MVTSLCLALASGFTILLPAVPAAADGTPDISLSKSAPGSVLVGEPVTYTLTVSNPAGAVPAFNLSLRDVLPVGMTYVPGSTTPADVGDPTLIADQPTLRQSTLIWSNVADPPPNGSYTLSFQALPDPASYPVGATVTNTADAYVNSNARNVPAFNPDGTVVPGTDSYTGSDSDSSSPTTVSAFEVTKSEPSPEGELLRGVHDNTTVYTLNVRNNPGLPTDGIVVVDYVPAGLEFLACGGVDNTTNQQPEYAGAPSLTAVPAAGPDCRTPDSVDTVTNPAGLAAGVYTAVTWTVGDLAAGGTTTITYRAGIPLQSNTDTWPNSRPTADSGDQGANLDNNTGASTAEGASELGLTNYVRASGSYEGSVVGGGSTVTAETDASVTAEDLAMQKSVSPATFIRNEVATYTLVLRTGEYRQVNGLIITDVLPNGVCPLSTTTNYVTGAPADCAPEPGFAPMNATIDSVIQHPDGTFSLALIPTTDMGANDTLTITYQGRMRSTYTGTGPAGGPDLTGRSTAEGDTFTNTATVDGNSAPLPGPNPPDPAPDVIVHDNSSATQTSEGGSIDKQVAPRLVPMDCGSAVYFNPTLVPDTRPLFQLGDRVCFRLRVNFAPENPTRNAVVTDYLPKGTRYEPGSAFVTPATTLPGDEISFNEGLAAAQLADPTWLLGRDDGTGGRLVDPGAVFEVELSAIIITTGNNPAAPQVLENLMKARAQNTFGQAISRRDKLEFQVAPPPPLALLKGVASVNGVPAGGNPPNVDNVPVTQGAQVGFRIDLSNNGTAPAGNDQTVRSLRVLDALPAGITCADISAISDGGSCFDAGALGRPNVLPATAAVLDWTLPPTDTIAPGATRAPLTYTMTVPTVESVSTVLTNTAAVSRYEVDNDIVQGGVPRTSTFFPTSNIDQAVVPSEQNAPPVSDTSSVVVPDVLITKTGTTSITEQNNNTPNQAVVGELVTYAISARIPAQTTVFNATLTDPLTTGIGFVSASAGYSATGVSPATAPLPTGVTLDPATGALTFPATYDNDTATDQLFEVTIVALVTTESSNINGVVRSNTATFASDTAETGGSPISPRTATYPITVVAPDPLLQKANNSTNGVVIGGQVVTYTLTATNPAGRPPAHDTIVVDCVPTGLAFIAYGTPTQGTTQSPVPGDGTNGCVSGTTRLLWDVGTLAGGANQTLTYTVTVEPTAAGGAIYANLATLTAGTLEDGKTDPTDPDNPDERTFVSQAQNVIEVLGAGLLKIVTPSRATIGQRVFYTVVSVIPPDVNFYDSAIIDQLPAGIDPSSLVRSRFVCLYIDATSCADTLSGDGSALTPAPQPDGSTLVGWFGGTVTSNPLVRFIVVEYNAVVQDIPANTAGHTLTNSVQNKWNLAEGPDPTSADAPFDRSGTPATATVTVIEPSLSIAKTVDDTTPEPGQTFNYQVTVNNASGATVSNAYDAVVVDHIPAGVVVTPGTITASGDLDAAAGTVTWTLPGPIAPGDSAVLGYQATLGNSTTLGTAALTNTVTVESYKSLPDGGRTYTGPSATATVTPAFPHVTPAKAVTNGDIAYVGTPFGWTLTLTNSGNGTAYGVDATDVLPPNWTYDAGSARVSVNGGPATPVEPTDTVAAVTHTLTWTNLGATPPTQAIVVTYTATPGPDAVIDPGAGLSVSHTNTVTTAAEDATGASGNQTGPYGSGSATAAAHIAMADLVVDKSHTDTFVAGSTGRWTVLVSNAGPDTAVGPFTVTDTVPPGVTLLSAAGTGWNCVPGAPLTCRRTDANETLASGAAFPVITLTVRISPSTPSGTTYTNQVQVTDRTYDPNLANNTDSDTVTITTAADLEIVKRHSSNAVAGNPLTWTIDVRNLGPSDSVGPITVTDTLPAGVSFTAAEGDGWVCGYDVPTRKVSCTRAETLAAGSSGPSIRLDVVVDSDQTQTISNTAGVTGTTPDPVPGNNTSTDPVPLTTEADLGVLKEHIGDLIAGSSGTYQFRADNYGPSDAAAPVTITDPLPAGLTFNGTVTSVVGSWACTGTTTVVCSLDGPLAAGEHATVQIGVDLDASATGTILNTATVASPTPDPNPGNNTDTDTTEFITQADLQIVKSHTGDATAGSQLTYQLLVTNNGPSDSPGAIAVTDPIPLGMSYVSAAGTDWSCAESSGLVTCTRATVLASGASAPPIALVVLVAEDAGPAIIVNTATVDGPLVDPVPENDHDSDPTRVNDLTNVSIVKSATATEVLAGENITYVLHVANDGPSTADDVIVSDPLPAFTTLVSATGVGWTCASTDVLVCTRPSLVVGSSADTDITVIVTTASSTPDGTTLTNTATVSTSTPGDNPDDNSSTVDVLVRAEADLSLTKTHPVGPVLAGGTVPFTLAVNNAGPSDAIAPVVVDDHLPVGLTYVAAGGGWSCVADPATDTGQDVTCTLDGSTPVLAGTDAPALTMTVAIDPAAPQGAYTNTGVVTSPTVDPDPGNNTATDVVDVTTAADLSIVKSHTATAHIGDPLTFSLAVRNDGPSTATDVVVTDDIPTGLTYQDATGSDPAWTCTATASTVTCALADPLPPDTDAPPLALTFTVSVEAYPTVANTSTVGSPVTDPDPTDNSSTDIMTVPAQVDLAITKTHTGDFVVGSTAQYSLSVVNNGPTDDPGPITVNDTLPAGLSYVSATGDGWQCSATGQDITCDLAAGLAVGASSDIALTVDVQPEAYPSVTNTATVSSPTEDLDPSNNTATDPAPITPLVDLSLTKSVSSADGDQVMWQIVVQNLGPNEAQGPITVTDDLPAGLSYVAASGDGWLCAVAGHLVTCTYQGTLAVGAQSTVELITTVTADPGSTVTNTATVTGGNDADSTNNTGSADFAVPAIPPTEPTDTGGGSSGQLPNTGVDVLDYLLSGVSLLILGCGLLLISRRRRFGER